MHYSTALIAVFATLASAAPRLEIERTNSDGTTDTFTRRADEEYTRTEVDLGVTYIDYGCDASMKDTLQWALDQLCRENAHSCDSTQTYSREVDWTDGSGPPDQWPITVTAEGEYPDKETLGYLKEIIVASVTDESWVRKDIKWRKNWGFGDIRTGTCPMSRFSNVIKATRWDDQNLESKIELIVSMETAEDDACSMFSDINQSVGAAAAAIFPLISAFSGPLQLAICEATGSEN